MNREHLDARAHAAHDFLKQHIAGVHYTIRIFIGTSVLWLLLHDEQTSDSLWAIISLIVVTEPRTQPAWAAFRARLLNTMIGSGIGLVFLLPAWPLEWMLTPAISVSALVATYINRVQQGWRIAPITTALILSASMTQHTFQGAFSLALHRTLEVFIGSMTAVIITAIMALIWVPRTAEPTPP